MYMEGGFIQSEIDPGSVSLASYIHAIYGLLYQADSQNILMIGCGGGTLGCFPNTVVMLRSWM
jgi:hypothetical protein